MLLLRPQTAALFAGFMVGAASRITRPAVPSRRAHGVLERVGMKAGALALTLALAACGGGKEEAAKVARLEEQVATLQKSLAAMRVDLLVAKYGGVQESAVFDPQEDKAYAQVKAPTGNILVVLEKLEPYLDGYVVTMRVGNPSTAGYSGIKGKVKWGHQYDSTKPDDYNALREKEIDLKDTLAPGAWTLVKFNIAPARPEDVRRIIFEPKLNSVQMRTAFLGS